MDGKWLIIAVLCLALVGVFIYGITYKRYGGELVLGNESIQSYESLSYLLNSGKIAIVMDTRGSTQEEKVRIFSCGVGFAQGLGRIGKNVSNFAFEEDYCITPEIKKMSINDCSTMIKENDYIILVQGISEMPKTYYYKDHMKVEVPKAGEVRCGITIRN
ncbi:MAG: hypothetical protein ACP5H8_01980 [Candidatus Micrarchaeia archaeon]